jgi:transcriptional regulator with XRE-family HTH domain
METKSKSSVPYMFYTLRLFKGKNLSSLSDSIGISRQSIHAWKRGANPSFGNVMSVALYLGVNAECFFDLEKFCGFLSTLNSSYESINIEMLTEIKQELCKC